MSSRLNIALYGDLESVANLLDEGHASIGEAQAALTNVIRHVISLSSDVRTLCDSITVQEKQAAVASKEVAL